jgi:hypothetical protein
MVSIIPSPDPIASHPDNIPMLVLKIQLNSRFVKSFWIPNQVWNDEK